MKNVSLFVISFCMMAISFVSMFLDVTSAYGLAPKAEVVGDRRVQVVYRGETAEFDIAPASWKVVENELYPNLPIYNPDEVLWQKGRVLRGVNACECAVFGALDPVSVLVKSESGEVLTRGVDYEFDNESGAMGRIEGGGVLSASNVLASYRCVESRIDSIVLDENNKMTLIAGEPRVLSPEPPVLKDGFKRLVNIYITGRDEALSDCFLFPIDEVFADEGNSLDAHAFVVNVRKFISDSGSEKTPEVSDFGAVKKFLPKVWDKLTKGEEIRVLAWGDSVTACGYLPENQRWQVLFANRLQKMFPKSKIVMLTEAWGGRSSDSYRNEPVGSEKNYAEKVLALKPDLIISEFVNDAYMDEQTVMRRYGEMLADFKGIGSEWIILGPHYVRPDWMGFDSEKDVDIDPRPLVKGLRAFASENKVPFADTPTLYGKLWRSGIPYNTLMTNNINHPNGFGMELFVAALMRLFEE